MLVPIIFDSSKSEGIKIKLSNPADAAWADTEFAKLPVEAHPTVLKPSSFAFERATATTLSLNDKDG